MSKVIPLSELNQLFGGNQEKLGNSKFCTGIALIQWNKQIKSGISNAGASQYLDGKFVEVNTTAMELTRDAIQAQHDTFMAYKYSPAGVAWQAACDLIRRTQVNFGSVAEAFPLPAVIEVTPDQLLHAASLTKRIETAEKKLKLSQEACAPVLKLIKDTIASSIIDEFKSIFESNKSNHIIVNESRIAITKKFIGDPSEDRLYLFNTIMSHSKASTIAEITIAHENLSLAAGLMVTHHEIAVAAGKSCPDPLTEAELGRHFVKKMINWNIPLFGGLNSVLYLLVDSGLKVVITASELWCLEHKSHDDDVNANKSYLLTSDIKPSISTTSIHYTTSSNNNNGKSVCYNWDGKTCSYESKHQKNCNYLHAPGQDTRSSKHSYSKSHDREHSRDRSHGREDTRSGSNYRQSYDRNLDSRRDRSTSRERDSRSDGRSSSFPRNSDHHRSQERPVELDRDHVRNPNGTSNQSSSRDRPAVEAPKTSVRFIDRRRPSSRSSSSERQPRKRPSSPKQDSLNY